MQGVLGNILYGKKTASYMAENTVYTIQETLSDVAVAFFFRTISSSLSGRL